MSKHALAADPPARPQPIHRSLHLSEPGCYLGPNLVHLVVDLLEALVHFDTQRAQLGQYQCYLFTARERLQECSEDRRLQVRAALQQLRQAIAEQIDHVFVTE